jgi:hypothetical protein
MKRLKIPRNVQVVDIEFLDEEEQELIIEKYKEEADSLRICWIRIYQVVTVSFMLCIALTAMTTNKFCLLVNMLSSKATISETNCMFAFCSTFICFCSCLVGLSWSRSNCEPNYFFMYGMIFPSFLFGISYYAKYIFVYYHFFPLLYTVICGIVIYSLDETKKNICKLEHLKYKYKKA